MKGYVQHTVEKILHSKNSAAHYAVRFRELDGWYRLRMKDSLIGLNTPRGTKVTVKIKYENIVDHSDVVLPTPYWTDFTPYKGDDWWMRDIHGIVLF